jgi:zinc transport system substrate-binding protein
MKTKTVFLLLVFISCFTDFTGATSVAAGKIKVSVSVLPQAYFIERIGGDRVQTQVMIPVGASPATYEPTPQQLIMLLDSRLYIKVGVPTFPFEKKYFNSIIEKNKNMIVVNMSDGVKYRSFSFKENIKDPHVWVAPYTVEMAAKNICNALSGIDPFNKAYYKKNLDLFLTDISRLDNHIKAVLTGKQGGYFMVFHPAWGYFADQYGLKQLSIELEGKTPNASDIKKMIDTAREKDIKIIFVQKGFDKKSAKTVAREIHGRVMEIDPLEKDWLKNMQKIAETFSRALKQ